MSRTVLNDRQTFETNRRHVHMGVVSSASSAIDALARNPVLFVAAFLVGLVNLGIVGVVWTVVPVTASLYWWLGSMVALLISLFFVGGAYGMASEGLRGETRFRTLLSAGSANYLSLVGATFLLVLVGVAISILIALVGLALWFASPGRFGGGLVALLLVTYGSSLIALLPYFLLQFYAPAVVVSDEGAVDSLKRSFGLVRRNLLGTLGFDAVILAVIVVGAAPTVWLYARWWNSVAGSFESSPSATPEMVSPFAGLDVGTTAAYVLSTLVLLTLSGAFFYTYQVAFYEDLLGEETRATFDATD